MEVIPWLRKNNYYDNGVTTRTNVALDRTVFVGGIPGDFTADELAHAFQNEFGSVESVHYHTDTTFYPTGKLLIIRHQTLASESCIRQPTEVCSLIARVFL